MNKPELAIVIILRLIGVSGLFAIPAIFFPITWMAAIHDYVGLGPMPEGPMVSYLARSLSAFYAAISAITLCISTDIHRYAPLVRLWAIIVIVIGDFWRGARCSRSPPEIAASLCANGQLFWAISSHIAVKRTRICG